MLTPPIMTVGCLNRVMLLGERHLRRTKSEFVSHYHAERNHQDIGNELIQPLKRVDGQGMVRRRQRMGGMLNFTTGRPQSKPGEPMGAVPGQYAVGDVTLLSPT
jgi:hypothetical protein